MEDNIIIGIFACSAAFFLIVFLWKMIKMIIAVAAIIFMGYVYVTYDEVSNYESSESAFQYEDYQQYETTPVYNKDLEQLLTGSDSKLEKSTITIDVHHYFHDNGSDGTNKKELFPGKTQRVQHQNTAPAPKKVQEQPDFCNNFKIKGEKYLLVEGIYNNQQDAEYRLRQLADQRINGADIIWLPCYENDLKNNGFAIVLGRPCNSVSSAEKTKRDYLFDLYSADVIQQTPIIIFIKAQKLKNDMDVDMLFNKRQKDTANEMI